MKVTVVVPGRPQLNKPYADRNDARRLVTPIELDEDARRVTIRYADNRTARLTYGTFHKVFCLQKGPKS